MLTSAFNCFKGGGGGEGNLFYELSHDPGVIIYTRSPINWLWLTFEEFRRKMGLSAIAAIFRVRAVPS